MSRILLLDRDGVINQDSLHYIKSPDEFIPIPGSIEAIARLTQAGYRLGVATNQSGVSRGLYTEEILSAIHRKMFDLVENAGGRIDFVEYCIHMPDSGCFCRKPKPGMLINLAMRFHSPLTGVDFVGDRLSDIQAAEAAGANPVIILSPMTDRAGLINYPHVPAYKNLAHYVDMLLGHP